MNEGQFLRASASPQPAESQSLTPLGHQMLFLGGQRGEMMRSSNAPREVDSNTVPPLCETISKFVGTALKSDRDSTQLLRGSEQSQPTRVSDTSQIHQVADKTQTNLSHSYSNVKEAWRADEKSGGDGAARWALVAAEVAALVLCGRIAVKGIGAGPSAIAEQAGKIIKAFSGATDKAKAAARAAESVFPISGEELRAAESVTGSGAQTKATERFIPTIETTQRRKQFMV